MEDKKRLINLINQGLLKQGQGWRTEIVADHLLQSGVIVLPMPVTEELRAELAEYCFKRCVDEL